MTPHSAELKAEWEKRMTCSHTCRQLLGGMRRRMRSSPPLLQDVDWLRRAYVDDERATTHMAAEVGCSAGAVIKALRRQGIKMRTQSEERRKHMKFQLTEEWLQAEYVEKKRFAKDLALEAGCSTVTVINTLHSFAMPVRTDDRVAGLLRSNERRKRPTAARKLSYAQRRQVHGLNSSCALCDANDDLDVHHRDADRANDKLKNLVVLCHDCHAVAEWFIGPVETRLRNQLQERTGNG